MKLTREEKAMLAGEMGQAAGEALAKQMKVGAFFHAADFVPVRTVHVMADIEALADPGLRFLEETAAGGGRFRVPVTTNPRSVDFSLWREVGQEEEEMIKERRIVDALTSGWARFRATPASTIRPWTLPDSANTWVGAIRAP